MPQVKTNSPAESRGKQGSEATPFQRPTVSDARDLIAQMLNYEAAVRERGANFASRQFKRLTAPEQQFIRAELVAEYIELSMQSTATAPTRCNKSLVSFCSRVCDMGVPSQELIGTYLAAVDVVAEEPHLKKVESLNEAVRRTMVVVLKTCVDLMRKKAGKAEKAAKPAKVSA